MPKKKNRIKRFFKELKRRKVWRVLIAYAGFAAIILGVMPTIQEGLFLPDWTDTLTIILLAIIFSHLSHKTMNMRPVIIGDNCFIGNKSIILPGVIIEDNVIVEPGCVVPMNQVLKKGKRYTGNPAEEVQDS